MPSAHRIAVLAALAALAAGGAGCGGEATPSPPAGTGPVVTSFDADDVDCSLGTLGTVFVEWETANATGVEIAVDGGDPALAEPSGALTLTVPCDGEEHTVSLTPLDASGKGETAIRTVE
ncbi:MAG: hypothetical protein KatS3mg012_0405 [Gaiellaceae bacterium]|nr:MAG: hypothetical protein KatS3mg012_0405 [Gaiellaceae bacterium]